MTASRPAVDRRRQILDAAVRVFARRGFQGTRVADIADEAGVAYGLVYHYFRSKDHVLDTLFTERWSILLDALAQAAASDVPAREKLHAVASFIVDSYRRDPDLMKVIVVEVTRAANTFGAAHLGEIQQAHDRLRDVIADAQRTGEFRSAVSARTAALTFYGALEQMLTAWIFGLLDEGEEAYERATAEVVGAICDGLAA